MGEKEHTTVKSPALNNRKLAQLLASPGKGILPVLELVRIAANSPILGTLHLRNRAADIVLCQDDTVAVEARDALLLRASFEVAGVEVGCGGGAGAGVFLGDVAEFVCSGSGLGNWGGGCDSHEAVEEEISHVELHYD